MALENPTKLQQKLLDMPLATRLIAMQDPAIFVASCVRTRDEVNAKEPVRLAPMTPGREGYKPYLEPIIRVWQKEPLVVIDKSRRLWISYLMLSLHLHMAFTNVDRRIGIMSKKFDDSAEHLLNMQRIYESIPEEIYPAATRPTLRTKEGQLIFTEIDSVVHGIASGPDQARQFGYTAIFWDEADFCEKQELTYGALAPTLQNGGKLTLASTHAMVDTGVDSFYRCLIEDRL